MDSDFLKGFSQDPETRKQAEHIWKMLDQMAEDNPDGYKKFVSQNIEEGAKDIKKKQDDSLQAQMVNPTPKLAFKVFASLVSKSNNPDSTKEQKFNINQEQIFAAQAKISKLDKRVKFYMNLLVHSNVMYALNQKREELTFKDDIRLWQLVPLSFSQLISKPSTSFGYQVYYVDVVMNDQAYEKILGSYKQTDDYFLKLLSNAFQARLQSDRNPIQVDFQILKSIYYYEFENLSCNRLKNKQYKQYNGKGPIPLLLEYQINKVAQDQIKKKQAQQATTQSQDVKFKTEEKSDDKQIEKNIQSILGIDKVKKPSLIQEIPEEQLKKAPPIIKEIILPIVKIIAPNFTLDDSGKDIVVIIDLPKVTNFNEIDLQISKSEIKLEVTGTYVLSHQLNYQVDNDNLKAKWDKKNRKLTLRLNKI